jgi:hypothetical protein
VRSRSPFTEFYQISVSRTSKPGKGGALPASAYRITQEESVYNKLLLILMKAVVDCITLLCDKLASNLDVFTIKSCKKGAYQIRPVCPSVRIQLRNRLKDFHGMRH